MQNLWNQIEPTLNKEMLGDLNYGASEDDINKLEALVGQTLPTDFRDFLKIHNGQKGNVTGLFDDNFFLSTEEIASNWKIWKELEDSDTFKDSTTNADSEIKPDWWNQAWIPFTDDGSGNHLCIDLSPTPEGTVGQIIEMWHDDGSRKIVVKNFSDFLSKNFKFN